MDIEADVQHVMSHHFLLSWIPPYMLSFKHLAATALAAHVTLRALGSQASLLADVCRGRPYRTTEKARASSLFSLDRLVALA